MLIIVHDHVQNILKKKTYLTSISCPYHMQIAGISDPTITMLDQRFLSIFLILLPVFFLIREVYDLMYNRGDDFGWSAFKVMMLLFIWGY